ncbi:DUF3078 domain-containing protein [Aliifodinibius sp. S!AR15-10]|uniref:DUF3078 domain-containing protein n=1 Tax=Aliifodinibius sp. S!AR15-10 TaxID=2950437 RepID=UPI0028627AF9|nr:DUF3078 domain-containing protein [Aliifodinibius sp. S!AR15-10]MDR8393624.1 DUF3078 domain-containing protein [Aliifodinibius sp. S!AR15-10]
MMKKLLPLFALLLFTGTQLHAQETIIVSDTLQGWDYSWLAGLNASQASYSNWAQGGVNNISASGNSTLTMKHRKDKFGYGFLLGTRYGKSKIEGQGTRKTDDRLSIRNRFTYDLARANGSYSAYGNINFRTQFDKGYEYDAGPNDEDVLISRFMAPAYFSQGAGIAYIPSDYFSAEAGLALKQTIVTDDDLETLYGLDEGETLRNEGGITLGLGYDQAIAPNFQLSSSVETFTNVNTAISSTDVYFSTQVTGKVNDLINTSLRVDLAYDDDFSSEIQVLQVFSLGISFILI